MRFSDLFVGALTLNGSMMRALRGRSDVFYRGFLVLFFAALVVGLFASIPAVLNRVSPPSEADISQIALNQFNSQFRGSEELRAQIQPYVVETAGMIYDILRLPPRTGESARPFIALLDYIGAVLATPFTWAFAGWLLFAGLLFQVTSRWLGGKANLAQMLGLTALAAAPKIFASLTALLDLLTLRANLPLLGVISSLLGLVIAVWSAAIYVKATAVAQDFSIGNALVAIVLGFVVLIVVALVLIILLVAAVSIFGLSLAR